MSTASRPARCRQASQPLGQRHRLTPERGHPGVVHQGQGGKGRPDGSRREAGVEDEGARGVDEVAAQRGRSEDGAALAAQRLGQGERRHDVGLTGQADGGAGTCTGRTDHTEGVRFVDEQDRAVAAYRLVQCRQGREVAVHREDRVSDDQGPLLGASGEDGLHCRGVGVWDHLHPGP